MFGMDLPGVSRCTELTVHTTTIILGLLEWFLKRRILQIVLHHSFFNKKDLQFASWKKPMKMRLAEK
jgi:hypothetical protein